MALYNIILSETNNELYKELDVIYSNINHPHITYGVNINNEETGVKIRKQFYLLNKAVYFYFNN